MTNQKNFSVLQTQKKIKSAFWQNLALEGYASLSVKQILQTAKINRSTFYTYFNNKNDLLDAVEEDLFQGFHEVSLDVPLNEITASQPNKKIMQEYYHKLVEYIYQNGQKFELLASDKGDPAFLSKLLKLDQGIWETNKLIKKVTVPQHYAFMGILSLITSLINDWAKHGFQESPQEFEKILSAMITPILLGDLFNNN